MQIKYSKHMETRIVLRKIDYGLPGKSYKNAKEQFIDKETGHTIAVTKTAIYVKERDLMVAYKYEDRVVTLLTIHPLKEGQKEKRIRSGRWRKI